MSKELLIVLPTYNEGRNIGPLTAELRRLAPTASLLIIDDNSPDGTGRISDELAANDRAIEVVHRPAKAGLGTAHVLGMDRAIEGGYRVLVTMDCDFTHRPDDVMLLVSALGERGADMVIGSKYIHPDGIRDWSLRRRAITHTAHFLTRNLLGIRYDATNAFRAYRVAALRTVPYRDVRGDGYSFMFEMVYACVAAGIRVEEVPVMLPLRQAGKSKINRGEIAKAIFALLRLATARFGSRLRRAKPVVKETR